MYRVELHVEEFWASGPLFLPHKSPAALITLRSTLTPEINRSHRVDLRKIESASLRGLFFEIFTLQCCSRALPGFYPCWASGPLCSTVYTYKVFNYKNDNWCWYGDVLPSLIYDLKTWPLAQMLRIIINKIGTDYNGDILEIISGAGTEMYCSFSFFPWTTCSEWTTCPEFFYSYLYVVLSTFTTTRGYLVLLYIVALPSLSLMVHI